MKPVFTAQQMRETEERYFASGVCSSDLMQTAGVEFEKVIEKLACPEGITCVFACGIGGNGGDGYVAARRFAEHGGRAVVLSLGIPKRKDAYEKYVKAKENAFAFIGPEVLKDLPRPDIWADCLFGVGLSRDVDGIAREIIKRMADDRGKGSKVISCDIPSGLDSDDGSIRGISVCADATVTFQTLKRGHLLGNGPDVCGELFVRDIGIPESLYPNKFMEMVEDEDIPSVMINRPVTAHKNTFGHLLVVAGSFGMAGAAALCASAALRSGVGLVTVACPASIVPIIQTLAPCAMCIPLSEVNGAVSDEAFDELSNALRGKTAIALGPGLSRKASPKCIESLMKSGLPMVIDADALNIISENEYLKALLNLHIAVTPHPGEAMRLTEAESKDAVSLAENIRKYGCSVLLKGASSVILGEKLRVSTSGTNGMAKGGSGDVLTGIVGTLLAQGMKPEEALWAASQIHGRAGEEAGKLYGKVSMLPTDIISCLGKVFENAKA